MRSLELAFQGGSKVLMAGLAFGAGLPVIYALAMRLLTLGATQAVDTDGRTHTTYTPMGKALAAVLMLIIAGAIALGITMIAASGMGKAVSFDHIIPTIVEKKK
ncbi:MAG: hypothetical protein IPH03_09615 [Tetrasphaera sp.]|jgi:hypothetical protein|nr:hypothetical protein [Tetrasphaera sp.]